MRRVIDLDKFEAGNHSQDLYNRIKDKSSLTDVSICIQILI